ncbi:MAG: flavodoxin family protein [Pseudomonadota bacterium]
MRALALNGSPRRNGNTEMLLRMVLAELQAAGVTTELVQLGGLHLRGCQACGGCKRNLDARCTLADDGLNGLLEKMLAADVILIGSPTYFADVTTEVKALIDRAGYVARANGNLLARKLGAAVVAVRRAGAIHAFDTINHFFLVSEMVVVGSSYWNLGIGRERGEVAGDAEGVATMQALGRNLAWALERLGAGSC